MEKISPRHTNYALVIVLIGIVAVYAITVFLPNRRNAMALQQQLQTDRAFIAQTADLSDAIANVRKEIEQIENYTTKWREKTPRKSEIPRLFAKLDYLAARAGVSTVRLDPLPVIEHESLRQVPVTLAVTGSFTQVFSLLNGIETLSEPIWIDDVKMEATREDTDSVECQLKLVMFASKSEDSD